MDRKLTDFQQDNLIWNKDAFPNKLQDGEDIVLVIREDILIVGFKFLMYFVIFVVLLILKIFLSSLGNITLLNLFDLAFYTANSFLVLFFAYQFHNYYLSLQIVTDRRLIDIDQTGLFSREVNELSIDKIEDVSYRQNGVWGALFNFGTVTVQTAADVSTDTSKNQNITGGFVFQNVPAPAQTHAIITELYHNNKSKDAHFNAELQAKYMSNALDEKEEE